MEKSIDLTFIKMLQEKRELEERNARAAAYSAKIERKRARKAERKRRTLEIVRNVTLTGVIIAGVVMLALHGLPNLPKPEHRYAIPSESTQGLHYIYVTERYCTVTEITADYVTVSYNGNEYSFFGYGYEVGDEIICQFTDGWEIVGVTEREV